MCLEIHTQRDISAQIIRHRSFSFQEFSQRYAEAEKAKVPQFRRQDSRNRQNSIDDLTDEQLDLLEELTYKALQEGYELYQTMLEMGVAKRNSTPHSPDVQPNEDLHERKPALMDSLHRAQDPQRNAVGASHHRQSGEDHLRTTIPRHL